MEMLKYWEYCSMIYAIYNNKLDASQQPTKTIPYLTISTFAFPLKKIAYYNLFC